LKVTLKLFLLAHDEITMRPLCSRNASAKCDGVYESISSFSHARLEYAPIEMQQDWFIEPSLDEHANSRNNGLKTSTDDPG